MTSLEPCIVDANFNRYYNNLKSCKPLSKIEEYELCKKFKLKQDISARNKVITANLRFVVDIAKNYQNRGLPLTELIAAGNMGLLYALDKFDYNKGFKFITYAVWWIRQYIQESIKNKGKLSTEELPIENCQFKCDEDGVLIENKKNMDNFLYEEYDNEDYEEKQEKILKLLLSCLDEREYQIIMSYYGINGKEKTLDEIGKKFRITKMRVQQLKERALTKMRANGVCLNVNQIFKK